MLNDVNDKEKEDWIFFFFQQEKRKAIIKFMGKNSYNLFLYGAPQNMVSF